MSWKTLLLGFQKIPSQKLPLGSAKLLTAVSSFAEPSGNFWEGIFWNPRSNVFQLTKTLASTYRVDFFIPSSRLRHPVEPTHSAKSTLSTTFSRQLIIMILLIRNRGHNSTQLLHFLPIYFLHIKVFFVRKVSLFRENNILNIWYIVTYKNETFEIFYRKVSSKYHKIARSIINFGFEVN